MYRLLFLSTFLIIFSEYSFAFHSDVKPTMRITRVDENGIPLSWSKSNKKKNKSNKLDLSHDEDLETFIGGTAYFLWENLNYEGTISNPRLIGSATLNIVSTSCNHTENYCATVISFTPTVEGYASSAYYQTLKPCPGCPSTTLHGFVQGLGLKENEEPECPVVKKGSIIKTEQRALQEKVEIPGTEFHLSYSSELTPQYKSKFLTFNRVNHFNPEGWSVSVVHHYQNGYLVLGTGDKIARNVSLNSENKRIVPYGDEVFIFDSTGKHLETKSALTGYVKYQFSYSAQSKLTKITDAYGKETTFERDESGRLNLIVSPFGIETSITVDANGLITEIDNQNDNPYEFTYYSGSELMESFKKPNEHESIFEYTGTGRMFLDEGMGGNFWELQEGYGSQGGYLRVESAMARTTRYSRSRDSEGKYVRLETEPSGLINIYNEERGLSQYHKNKFESKYYLRGRDERFGSVLPRLVRTTETTSQGLSRITTVAKVVNLANPNDPFSYSEIKTITDVNGNKTINTFNKANLTSRTVSPEGVATLVQLNQFEKPVSIQHASDVPLSITYDNSGRLSEMSQNGHNTINYTYGTNGWLESVTNALGQITAFDHDDFGRVTSITYPDLRVVNLSYDGDGKLIQLTPAGRPAHSFIYNDLEELETYSPPLLNGNATNTNYVYNLDKQLTEILYPDNRKVLFNHDENTGLLTNITGERNDVPTGEVQAYVYHPESENIKTITSFDQVVSEFNYSGMDRIASEYQTMDGTTLRIHFRYDNLFRPIERI